MADNRRPLPPPPQGRPVPLVPAARRRSSDDLARVVAEEAAAQREAELLTENTRLRERERQLEDLVREALGRIDRVEKRSAVPPPARSALAQLQQFWPHAAAIITALAGLVVSFKALTKPEPTDRSELVYDALREEIGKKTSEQQRLARELGELRAYQERLARERAVEPAPRSRSKAAPSSTGPDLPPPVPRAAPEPVQLPETLDALEAEAEKR